MTSFFAMQRANGDWFGLAHSGRLCMPVFYSNRDAMIARSRESGMECFRPAAIDAGTVEKIRVTEGDTASFLVVTDPLRELKHGRHIGFAELAVLIARLKSARLRNGES